MSISAAKVMQLREITGAGMMECKKFLIATNGDIEQAILEMRKAGQLKAQTKSSRVAAEGIIAISRSTDGKRAVILEINSETDFVARDSNFTEFARCVSELALQLETEDIQILGKATLDNNETVDQVRAALVAKVGENIQLRRMDVLRSPGTVGTYLHGSRIGVIVALSTDNETLAKDIAMHIAAQKPLVVNKESVSPDLLEREREVYRAQAAESGKPKDIIEKMVEGKLNKYLDEICLMSQSYVKDPDKRIDELLKEHQSTVIGFVRYEVGEGIEKKKENFAEEVMSQVKQQ